MNTEDLYRLLRTGHVEAQGIVDTVAEPLLVLDASLCVKSASRSFYEAFKVDRYDTVGKHISDLGNGQWNIPALRELLSNVIPNSSAVIDYRVEHEFPSIGKRTMLLTARTLFNPDHSLDALLLSIADVTEQDRRQAAREMQFGEVLHRMKNLLGVVRSLATQMPTEGRSAVEYRDAFLGRFAALVSAQTLTFSDHNEASLSAAVERILAPYTGNPVAVVVDAGPAVQLHSGMVFPLLLVLHELATNALKYGALSVPGGQVRVSWQVEANTLVIKWVESGGPPVIQPTTTGFGTHLIQSASAYSLGAEVKLRYEASGVEAEIAIPLG